MAHEQRNRTERISSRLKPQQKQRLEDAAALAGETLTEFLLQSAEERAQRLLRDREVLELRGRASALFVQLLTSPPAPTEALRTAFERHDREVESR